MEAMPLFPERCVVETKVQHLRQLPGMPWSQVVAEHVTQQVKGRDGKPIHFAERGNRQSGYIHPFATTPKLFHARCGNAIPDLAPDGVM